MNLRKTINMKIIYRRKSYKLYQKGIFISLKSVNRLLMVLVLFLFYSIFTSDWNEWIILCVTSILGLIIYSLISIENKLDISFNSEIDDSNLSLYIGKKIKKKRTKIIKKKLYSPVHIIGDYEYNAIINNYPELIDYYGNCLKELDKLIKNSHKNLDVLKTSYLHRKLSERLKILKGLEEFI